jgi:hypothetical protein
VGVQAAIITGIFVLLGVVINLLLSPRAPTVSVGDSNTGQVVSIERANDVVISQNQAAYEAELSGLLIPGKLPSPSREKDPPQKGFRVYLGKNVCELTKARDIAVLKRNGLDLIRLRILPEGVYVSATVIREDGRIVAEIVNNEYSINPNNYFQSPIRTDKSTITVRDKGGNVALKASYLNENSFEILGTFELPGFPPLLVTPDKIELETNRLSGVTVTDPGKACYVFN